MNTQLPIGNIKARIADAITRGLAVDGVIDSNVNNEGNTMLHLAVRFDLTEEVALLLSRGARIDIKNSEGNTAIHIALSEGNQRLLQVIYRREKYLNRLEKISNLNSTIESSRFRDIASNILDDDVQHGIIPYELTAVHEDYLDWSDEKRILRTKVASDIMFYHIILYYNMLYHIILYFIIAYYIILFRLLFYLCHLSFMSS